MRVWWHLSNESYLHYLEVYILCPYPAKRLFDIRSRKGKIFFYRTVHHYSTMFPRQRVWRQTLNARHPAALWNFPAFVRLELRNAGSLTCCSGLQQFLYQSGWNIALLQTCELVCRCEMRAHVEPHLSNGGRKCRDFGARKWYLQECHSFIYGGNDH